MAEVNVGSTPNDNTGDPLRTAFVKINTDITALKQGLSAIEQVPDATALIAARDAAVGAAEQAEDDRIAAQQSATEAALYDGPKVDTFSQLAAVTPTMLAVGGLIRVIATGRVYQRVSSGGDLDYSGAGGVRLNVLPETLTTPYLEQTTKALQLVPWALHDDILSGAMTQDHTAALAAVFADPTIKRSLEFPAGAVFGISQALIPPTTTAREIMMNGATFKGRAGQTAGNFVQLLTPSNAYGQWTGLRMEHGIIDQADMQIGGKVFRTLFLNDARFTGMTVKHRTAERRMVTLNATTDVFTISSGTNPWVNGDFVSVETAESNQAGNHPGSGTRMYVVNRTDTTFQLSLTAGGASINWSSSGSGLFVFDYGAWGWMIGGRKIQISDSVVENGTEIYQDGFHIAHGRDITLTGCRSYAGDDAIALGSEEAIETEGITDVSVAGFVGHSRTAFLVGIYAAENYGSRKIRNVEMTGLVGSAGTIRNGAFKIRDYGDIGSRENPSIDGVTISNTSVTVGSPDRTDNASLIIARVWGSANVDIDAKVRLVGTQQYSATDIQRSRDVNVRLQMIEGHIRAVSTRATTSRITETVIDKDNKIPSPRQLQGLVPGTHGASEGFPPFGWSNDTSGAGGSYAKSIFIGGQRPEGAILGWRFSGTVGAGTYDIALPLGPETKTEFSEAKIACAAGQVATAKVMMAVQGNVPAGVQFVLAIKERLANGVFVGASSDFQSIGPGFEQHRLRTYICEGSNVIGLSVQVLIPANTALGNFSLLICDPQLVLA